MSNSILSLNEKDESIPRLQRWIYKILFLRVLFFIITFTITIYVLENKVEEGVLNKITSFTIAKYLKLIPGNPFELAPEISGQLFGGNILILITLYIQYYSLKNKKEVGFWIAWVFDFLFVLSYPFIPLMPLITLILKIISSIRKVNSKAVIYDDELLDNNL